LIYNKIRDICQLGLLAEISERGSEILADVAIRSFEKLPVTVQLVFECMPLPKTPSAIILPG
jgi:hypothetical protein